jgi:hypothetical protein
MRSLIRRASIRGRLPSSAALLLAAQLWSPLLARSQEPAPESLPTDASPEEESEELIAPAATADATTSEPSAEAPAPAQPSASATPTKKPDEASGSRVEISAAPGKGLTVNVSDQFSLNIRARIQVRYQLIIPPEDAEGQRDLGQIVNIGTARLWLSGNIIVPELLYMIQLAVAGRDFRDGATTPLYDAYLEWRVHRDFNVRVGQYFVPFDRLRTIREWALQMCDRPVPVNLFALDRDVGVTFYSDRFLGSPLAWHIGVFGGGGTNVLTRQEPGALVVGRLVLRPLGPIDDDIEGDLMRRKKPGLALGGGYAANFNTNRVRSTTGLIFEGGTTDYFNAAADLVFKWRGFALEAQYISRKASNDEIISTLEDGSTLTEYTHSGRGWISQASYVFDPPIEVVGRLSRSYAFPGTDPRFIEEIDNLGQEVGAGLNYYFNFHWLKVQADWIARMPRDFNFERALHVVHVQLDATF